MSIFKTNSITKITGVFILLTIVFTIVSQGKWDKENGVIGADVRGYYAYLPALFIHNDLKFENLEVYKNEKGYEVWVSEDEKGRRFIKYTSGMSIMYSPFFLVSHALASPLGAKADGFSYPYKTGLIVGSLFYLVIGLIFISKLLLRYFEDRVVSIALLILYLGTNLFEYETGHLALSHGYSFALIALFMYSTVTWLDKPKLKWAIWMGVSGGLMLLIRPIDLVFLSFIVLIGVRSLEDLKLRFKLIWSNKIHVFVFLGFGFLMLLPQLLYYKHVFGHFIYYSYTKEGFFFLTPHLYDTMFSFRNGWLIYSPIMVFALVGFFFTKRISNQFTFFSPFAFLVYFYVLSSWWCWWYAGFGNRAFINLYPVLAIPLCALIAYVLNKKFYINIGFKALVFAFILLNVFQSYQFEKGIIHWGYMSSDAYWHAFGRTKPTSIQHLYYEYPEMDQALLGKDVVSVLIVDTISTRLNGFEDTQRSDSAYYPFLQKESFFKGRAALFVPNQPYALQSSFAIPNHANNICVSAWVKTSNELRIVVVGDDKTPFYAASNQIYESRNGWQKLYLFAQLPKEVKYDSLEYYIWNEEMGEYYIDELKIECFNVSPKTVEL